MKRFALASFLCCVCAASTTMAQFARIADTSGGYSSFFGIPAINNSGKVSFFGGLDSGGGGIFVGDGTSDTEIASTNDGFSGFNATMNINAHGQVAFSVSSAPGGGRGIFVGNGNTISTIEHSNGPFNFFGGFPGINDSGEVAYQADRDFSIATGIYKESDTGFTIVSESALSSSYQPNVVINNSGVVAFHLNNAIYLGSGGLATKIVDNSGQFQVFSGSDLNNSGQLAFVASLDAGGSGVFVYESGNFSTFVQGPQFHSFATYPALNDLGQIAFLASTNIGVRGIFDGPDPLNDRLVAIGDSLDGSFITDLQFGRYGLNDSGTIAFLATLADGRSGIYVKFASVPEPSTLIGLSFLFLCISTWFRRTRIVQTV